jgi:hypothetical protein
MTCHPTVLDKVKGNQRLAERRQDHPSTPDGVLKLRDGLCAMTACSADQLPEDARTNATAFGISPEAGRRSRETA